MNLDTIRFFLSDEQKEYFDFLSKVYHNQLSEEEIDDWLEQKGLDRSLLNDLMEKVNFGYQFAGQNDICNIKQEDNDIEKNNMNDNMTNIRQQDDIENRETIKYNSLQSKLPKGVRDFNPDQEKLRNNLLKDIENIFMLYDAKRIDTPIIELYDILVDKKEDKEIFTLESRKEGHEKLALRYDLTVPFSRYVKMNRIKKMRRYQIGKVFRRDKPSPGRYREFMQCDYDNLGNNDENLTDIETLNLLADILKMIRRDYNLPPYTIKINKRSILFEIIQKAGIIMKEDIKSVCSSIDKLDKLSIDDVKKELAEKGILRENIEILFKLLSEKDKYREEFSDYLINSNVVIDLSLARGLDYYTGIIFEVILKDQNISIAGGGRYDNLCEQPCIGFSLGIDRILNFIKRKFSTDTKCYVIEINKNSKQEITKYRMEVVKHLRELGVNTGTSMKLGRSVKKEIKYASDNEIMYVIFVGEEELNNREVKIKNMLNSTQITRKFDSVLAPLGNNFL